MATLSLQAMKVNQPGNRRHYPEAATQTYIAGEPVYLDAGNKRITICGGDPATIMGISAEVASGVTSSSEPVYLADNENTFIANVYTDGTGAANAANALLLTDVGVDYDVIKVGVNWHIDKNAAGAKCVRILDRYPVSTEFGDFYGQAIFSFLNDVRQLYPGERTA